MFTRLKTLCSIVLPLLTITCVRRDAAPKSGAMSAATQEEFLESIYRSDEFAKSILKKILGVIKNHRENDPFHGGNYPGGKGFGMHRSPIGLLFDPQGESISLLLLNWNGVALPEMKCSTIESQINACIMSGIPLSALAKTSDKNSAKAFYSDISGDKFSQWSH
jgi:hypothetical protein